MFDASRISFRQVTEAAVPLAYRVTAYLMLIVLDDPAVLAMAFC